MLSCCSSSASNQVTEMSSNKAGGCCPTDIPPAMNNYQGVGKETSLEGHFATMYVTDPANVGKHAKTAIIQVTDIFGMSPNANQFADHLAKGINGIVIIPDLLNGDPWPIDNVPPTKEGKFPAGVEPDDGTGVLFTWIMTHNNTRLDRTADFQALKEYIHKEYPAVTKIGIVGMCWGGKVAYFTAKQGGIVDAVAGVHAAMIGKDDVESVDVPMCLLNSKEEPESMTTEIKPIFEAKDFADKNLFKTFPTMHHGWMGTRGVGENTDFAIAEQKEKYAEAMADLINFFNKAFA